MSRLHAPHFDSVERQAKAAHLGMWLFLASEILFFAGLFTLYAVYRTMHPEGFGSGVEHNTIAWGSANTAVLLVSSYTIAMAVHTLRSQQPRGAAAFVGMTIVLGVVFLAIKTSEYMKHFDEGIYPGGFGRFFEHGTEPGTQIFFTLYFGMTGLHALHVIAGTCILAVLMVKLLRGGIDPAHPYPLALGAVYWHLVDAVWIFLWPLFYLVPGNIR